MHGVFRGLMATAFRDALLFAKPQTCALNTWVFASSKGHNSNGTHFGSVGIEHIATREKRIAYCRVRDIRDSSRNRGIAFVGW